MLVPHSKNSCLHKQEASHRSATAPCERHHQQLACRLSGQQCCNAAFEEKVASTGQNRTIASPEHRVRATGGDLRVGSLVIERRHAEFNKNDCLRRPEPDRFAKASCENQMQQLACTLTGQQALVFTSKKYVSRHARTELSLRQGIVRGPPGATCV